MMDQSNISQKGQKLNLVLMLFYAMIILFPVVTYLTVYSASLSYITNQEIDSQMVLTDNGLSRMTDSLRYADSYIDSLVSLPETNAFLSTNTDQEKTLVQSIRSFHSVFPLFRDSNGILSTVLVYSKAGDVMIDRQSAYVPLSLHYKNLMPAGNLSYTEWREAFLDSSSAPSFLAYPNSSTPALYYVKKITTGLGKQGKAFFPFDLEKLTEALFIRSADVSKDIILLDQSGKILYSTLSDAAVSDTFLSEWSDSVNSGQSVKRRINGTDYLAFWSVSEGMECKVLTIIPYSFFTKSAFRVSLQIIQVSLPVLIALLLSLFFLLRSSHHSIKNTITALPQEQSIFTNNPFKYVQESVHRLSEFSEARELLLQQSRADMKESYINMLIYQHSSNSLPVGEKLNELGLCFDADHYRAVILVLFSAETLAPIPLNEQLLSVIQQYSFDLPELHYLKMLSPTELLYLAALDESEDRTERLKKSLSGLCWQITQILEDDVRVYLGEEAESLDAFHYSVKYAQNLLISSAVADGYIISKPSSQSSPGYDYQGYDSKFLRAAVSNGDYPSIQQRLDQLYARNTQDNARSAFEYLLLYTHMLNTLFESGYTAPLPSALTNKLSELTPKEFFTLLSECYSHICKDNLNLHSNQEVRLTDAILAEIQSNYSDYNLTMESVAKKYGMGERKLYNLLKSNIGCTFVEYLEKVRIEAAIEQLMNSKCTINELSAKVGYASDQSFRRAFKRITGKTPSDYRQ